MKTRYQALLVLTLVLSPGFSACYQGIDLGESELPEELETQDMSSDFEGESDGGIRPDAESDAGAVIPADLGPTFSASTVATGESTTCAINPEGEIWCWGLNRYGILGTTEFSNSHEPQRIGADTDWRDISVGDDFACATRTDDTLWCWGHNAEGQLTATDVDLSTEPLLIEIGAVRSFDLKNDHACAVTADQRLFCWGDNREAQVGQGTNEFSGNASFDLPKEVIEPGPWLAVSVGDAHSCALKVDESIWCWGRNTQFAASADETSQVLQPSQQAMPTSGSWKAISVGVYHSCGQANDGDWYCWGANRSGQIRFPSSDPIAALTPIERSDVDRFTANGFSACGVDLDDQAWCWGLNIDGHIVGVDQVHVITGPHMVSDGLGAIQDISVGRFHVCVLDSESRVWCAGSNKNGQLGNAEKFEDISTRWLPVPLL